MAHRFQLAPPSLPPLALLLGDRLLGGRPHCLPADPDSLLWLEWEISLESMTKKGDELSKEGNVELTRALDRSCVGRIGDDSRFDLVVGVGVGSLFPMGRIDAGVLPVGALAVFAHTGRRAWRGRNLFWVAHAGDTPAAWIL